jgi:hypothetical protein
MKLMLEQGVDTLKKIMIMYTNETQFVSVNLWIYPGTQYIICPKTWCCWKARLLDYSQGYCCFAEVDETVAWVLLFWDIFIERYSDLMYWRDVYQSFFLVKYLSELPKCK